MNTPQSSVFDVVCVGFLAATLAVGPAYSALMPGSAARSIALRERPVWTNGAKRDRVYLRRATQLTDAPGLNGSSGIILRLSLTLTLKPIEPIRTVSLFEAKTWTPKPLPQKAAAPPKPEAPPFPYRYMGRFTPDGEPETVYLTKGVQVYSVAVGGVLENMYRVVGITPDEVEVVYLPLGQKQLVSLSSTIPVVHAPPELASSGSPAPSPENPAPQPEPPRFQARIPFGEPVPPPPPPKGQQNPSDAPPGQPPAAPAAPSPPAAPPPDKPAASSSSLLVR